MKQTPKPQFPFPRFPIWPGNGEGIPDSAGIGNRETPFPDSAGNGKPASIAGRFAANTAFARGGGAN